MVLWRELEILRRSSLLSILLLVATGIVGWRTYSLWKEGPWDLPGPAKAKPAAVAETGQRDAKPKPPIGTEVIITKNLFDPERGASATREAESNSRAFQRVRSMILLGTAIIGNERFAVLQDGANVGGVPAAPGRSVTPMRFKLGDTVEGFRLAEVADRRVVFTKGASRVEVLLDYFRKQEVAETKAPAPRQPGTPGPAVPRVIPNLPRRDRLPIPANPNPNP